MRLETVTATAAPVSAGTENPIPLKISAPKAAMKIVMAVCLRKL